MQEVKRHYLYRITNLINGKIYIGQSVSPESRWRAHRRASEDPEWAIHYAMRKYGINNFEFEVIASGILPCTCLPGIAGLCQDDANYEETFFVAYYDSFIGDGKGYNETLGRDNA